MHPCYSSPVGSMLPTEYYILIFLSSLERQLNQLLLTKLGAPCRSNFGDINKWKHLKIDRNSIACVCTKMNFSNTNIMLYAPVKVLIRGLNNLHITKDLKKLYLEILWSVMFSRTNLK